MRTHTILCFALASASCVGVIEDANSFTRRPGAEAGAAAPGLLPGSANPGTSASSQVPGFAGAFAPTTPGARTAPGTASTTAGGAAQLPGNGLPGAIAGAAAPPTVGPSRNAAGWDPTALNAKGESVGIGDITKPAAGPRPTYEARFPGAPFVLVKNWDFGSDGTIAQMGDLIEEFVFHDQFGTIANGTNYGSVTVAPNAETAVTAKDLGLPNNRQPVDDPLRPYREFTPELIRTYVRSLSPNATSISASRHDSGNGSFMAKWKLPKGGSRLKQDVLWESRVRIATPAPAFWFSLWTAGQKWNKGAEMDVVESFGTPNIGPGAHAFHVNSVGGRDKQAYTSWPNELTALGVVTSDRDLSQWHVFTWVYLRDDSYQVYYDGYLVQQGTLVWTLGGSATGEELDMSFLFDFSWGHTQVSDVNITLQASQLPLTYELDYSRVYVRE